MVDHLDGDWLDGDWNDRMAALQRSARMERSQTVRRLLLRLFRRRGGRGRGVGAATFDGGPAGPRRRPLTA